MILFTNGCSWTWGGGLGLDESSHDELRYSLVWPHHLGKLVDAEKTYNLALGCGSNQRIVRTTFDWILSQPIENLQKTFAVIQLTELSRYEFYYPLDYDDHYENIEDRWVRCKVNCILNRHDTNETAKVKYNDLRLSTFTEIEGMYRLVGELLALDNLFKRYNIPYYFWSYDPNLLKPFPKEVHDFCRDNFNWLNSTDTGVWQYERVSELDDHPNRNGHIQIANILSNYIKN